jgi:hypothetical protein
LWKRVITWPLEPNVHTRFDQYGTLIDKVPLEAWEQLAERTLSPDQQSMRMSRLRRPRAVNRPIGKRVALEDDDLFKMIRQRPGRSQPCDPGPNDDGLACNCFRSHSISPSTTVRRFSFSQYYQTFLKGSAPTTSVANA